MAERAEIANQADAIEQHIDVVVKSVKHTADLGEKLFVGDYFGIGLWHFIVTLLFVVLFLSWTTKIHRHFGDRAQAYIKQRFPETQDRTILSMRWIFLGIFALFASYVLGLFLTEYTKILFDFSIAIIVIFVGQALFVMTNWTFRNQGERRSRFNRYIIAHMIKYVIVFFVTLVILLIFDVRISELLDVEVSNWVIPVLSATIFFPFVQSGGISAVRFAFTHPIRIGDWVQIGDVVGKFKYATAYSITLAKADGTQVTLPIKNIADDIVINLQTRHALRVEKMFYLDVDTTIDQVNGCIEGIGELFNGDDDKVYMSQCEVENIQGRIELFVVFNIRVETQEGITQKHLKKRSELMLKIIDSIRSQNVHMWKLHVLHESNEAV